MKSKEAFRRFVDDLDTCPSTKEFNVEFYARVSNKPHLDNFFNGNKEYEQVTNAKVGCVYKVVLVETFGDVSDFVFIDDNGNQSRLGSFFFEPIDD